MGGSETVSNRCQNEQFYATWEQVAGLVEIGECLKMQLNRIKSQAVCGWHAIPSQFTPYAAFLVALQCERCQWGRAQSPGVWDRRHWPLKCKHCPSLSATYNMANVC